jgi:hypothetical protein
LWGWHNVRSRLAVVVGARILIRASVSPLLILVGARVPVGPVLILVGMRVLRSSLMPNVLRIRASRRRHDDQAVDCQRYECRMKFASSPYLDVADQNLRIIAVGESNKTTSGATGKRLCERRRSFVRRSKSNYPLVTDAMISESAARSADLRAGARSKLDGACRITSALRRSVERRELIACQKLRFEL